MHPQSIASRVASVWIRCASWNTEVDQYLVDMREQLGLVEQQASKLLTNERGAQKKGLMEPVQVIASRTQNLLRFLAGIPITPSIPVKSARTMARGQLARTLKSLATGLAVEVGKLKEMVEAGAGPKMILDLLSKVQSTMKEIYKVSVSMRTEDDYGVIEEALKKTPLKRLLGKPYDGEQMFYALNKALMPYRGIVPVYNERTGDVHISSSRGDQLGLVHSGVGDLPSILVFSGPAEGNHVTREFLPGLAKLISSLL